MDQDAGDPQSPRRRRILIAEDHVLLRKIARESLEGLADISTAENGRAALQLVLGERFDAVLMDVQMPIMDGLAAVREIRRREAAARIAATPIIMYTSRAGRSAEWASFAAGADFHLPKPSPPGALMAAVVTAFCLRDARADEVRRLSKT